MTSKNPPIAAATVFKDPVHILAFGFGSGLSKYAPGTMGTMVAIPIAVVLLHLPLELYIALTSFLFVAGIFICGISAKRLGVHDHPGIVWDEIVGYLITLTATPAGWMWMIVGFILFRFFDIVKPWPLSWIDKTVGGGLGIMLDDAIAGIASCLIMYWAVGSWAS